MTVWTEVAATVESWADRAACASSGIDPDSWHPTGNDDPRAAVAVAVCRACPVRAECLGYALQHDVHGIWGGMTYWQRRNRRST